MTAGRGKSHSVGGRRVETLPRAARKPRSVARPRPALVLGLAGSVRPVSENVKPRGFWKNWQQLNMGGEEGGLGERRPSRNVNKDCVKAEASSFHRSCFFLILCFQL